MPAVGWVSPFGPNAVACLAQTLMQNRVQTQFIERVEPVHRLLQIIRSGARPQPLVDRISKIGYGPWHRLLSRFRWIKRKQIESAAGRASQRGDGQSLAISELQPEPVRLFGLALDPFRHERRTALRTFEHKARLHRRVAVQAVDRLG